MWFAQELRQSGQLTGNVTIYDEREKMASSIWQICISKTKQIEGSLQLQQGWWPAHLEQK